MRVIFYTGFGEGFGNGCERCWIIRWGRGVGRGLGYSMFVETKVSSLQSQLTRDNLYSFNYILCEITWEDPTYMYSLLNSQLVADIVLRAATWLIPPWGWGRFRSSNTLFTTRTTLLSGLVKV